MRAISRLTTVAAASLVLSAAAAGTARAGPTMTLTPIVALASNIADVPATTDITFDSPQFCRDARISGTTLLHIDLDQKGMLLGTFVTKSSGSPWLDRAALTAARSASYRAERQNGVAVGGAYQLAFDFVND